MVGYTDYIYDTIRMAASELYLILEFQAEDLHPGVLYQ